MYGAVPYIGYTIMYRQCGHFYFQYACSRHAGSLHLLFLVTLRPGLSSHLSFSCSLPSFLPCSLSTRKSDSCLQEAREENISLVSLQCPPSSVAQSTTLLYLSRPVFHSNIFFCQLYLPSLPHALTDIVNIYRKGERVKKHRAEYKYFDDGDHIKWHLCNWKENAERAGATPRQPLCMESAPGSLTPAPGCHPGVQMQWMVKSEQITSAARHRCMHVCACSRCKETFHLLSKLTPFCVCAWVHWWFSALGSMSRSHFSKAKTSSRISMTREEQSSRAYSKMSMLAC